MMVTRNSYFTYGHTIEASPCLVLQKELLVVGEDMDPRGEPTTAIFLSQCNFKLNSEYLSSYPLIKAVINLIREAFFIIPSVI